MSKSKGKNKQKSAEQKGQPGKQKGMKRRWTSAHVTAAFLIGAMFGFVLGFQPTTGEDSEETDAYGRSPSDPHYQHDHP